MGLFPRSLCAALLNTLLFTFVCRSYSLKVLRDSAAQNITYEKHETSLSLLLADNTTSDSGRRGTLLSVWASNVTPTTTAWPTPREAGNVTLLRFPFFARQLTSFGSKKASSFTIDSKIITRLLLCLLISLLCIGLALGYAEKSEDNDSIDLPRGTLGHYSDTRVLKKPLGVLIDNHDGDWSIRYHNTADQSQKKAFELLYLCDIIPVQDFLHAKVSQDHIDECLWIANAMLKQKTDRDWVESGVYARDFFNSCVTALYEARSDIKEGQRYEPPLSQSAGTSSEHQATKKRFAKSTLLERCREIMAETRREVAPRSPPVTSTSLDMQR
jgi:hypothetical protein